MLLFVDHNDDDDDDSYDDSNYDCDDDDCSDANQSQAIWCALYKQSPGDEGWQVCV